MRYKWVNILDPYTHVSGFLQENGLKRVLVDRQYLCIIRHANNYYAIRDRCPHAGARLSDGKCEGNTIICPLHRMAFDLNTGKEITGSGYGVERFPVENRPDGLFVGMPVKWWQ